MRIYASTRPLPVTICHTERTPSPSLKRDVIKNGPFGDLEVEVVDLAVLDRRLGATSKTRSSTLFRKTCTPRQYHGYAYDCSA